MFVICIGEKGEFLRFLIEILLSKHAVIDKYFQIIPLLFKLFAVVLENRLQAIGNFLCDIGRNLLHIRVALQIRTGYIQWNIRRINNSM